jgi:hypothetical protein
MDVGEFRKEIEKALEPSQTEESLEAASGSTLDESRQVLGDIRAASADRMLAFQRLLLGEPSDVRLELALARLADSEEASEIRVAALLYLKGAVFHSETYENWRPRLMDALRATLASSDRALRSEALEMLAVARDRYAQRLLLSGLRGESEPLVTPEEALRLLNYDIHTEVVSVAESFADSSDERTREEALRVLSNNASSAERFKSILEDPGESSNIRRLAASCLANLDRAALRQVAAQMAPSSLESVAETPASEVMLHVRSILESVD